MSAWLVALLLVLSIFVADATVGRWLAGKFGPNFARNPVAGEMTGYRHVLIYLPGTANDGVESIAEIEGTLRRDFHRILRISYGFWRFMPELVASRIALHVQKPRDNYDSITVVGSSMGTPLGIELVRALRTTYGWSSKSIDFVMVDGSPGSEYFAEPARTTSRILRWVYAGPLLSLLVVDPILSRLATPPRDANIEDGLDREMVKSRALKRMAKFHFSAICDQQRFLSRSIDWSPLEGVSVVYLSCTRNNETIVQPDAALEVRRIIWPIVSWLTEIPVDSTHCGFGERPSTWNKALGDTFALLRERSQYK